MSTKAMLAVRVLGVIALVFGLMTLKAGGAVIFDLGSARAEHGNYVPFVLWFNSLSGFAYVAAGVGLWLRRRWAAYLSAALVLGLVITSTGLAVHIISGGAFDRSTLVAMGIRLSLWIAIAAVAWVVLLSQRRLTEQFVGTSRGQP